MLQRGIDLLSLDASWYAAEAQPSNAPFTVRLIDVFVWTPQGELGLLVLPERVWTEEHVQSHPGPGQR